MDDSLRKGLMISLGVLAIFLGIILFDYRFIFSTFEHPFSSIIPFAWEGIINPLVWILLGISLILKGIRGLSDEAFFLILSFTIILFGIGHIDVFMVKICGSERIGPFSSIFLIIIGSLLLFVKVLYPRFSKKSS